MAKQKTREQIHEEIVAEILSSFGKGREADIYRSMTLEVLIDIRETLNTISEKLNESRD